MTIDEAREIIAYCEDRHLDFFTCSFSEADFKEAKGFMEGWNAAVKKCAEIEKEAVAVCRYLQEKSKPGEIDASVRTLAAEAIQEEILKLSIEEKSK